MNLFLILCFIGITATMTVGAGLKLEVHGQNMTGGCFYPDCHYPNEDIGTTQDDSCEYDNNCYIDLKTGEKHQEDGCTFPICYVPTDDEDIVEDNHCKLPHCYIDFDTGKRHYDKDKHSGDKKKHHDNDKDNDPCNYHGLDVCDSTRQGCDAEHFDCYSDDNGHSCTTGQCPGDDEPYGDDDGAKDSLKEFSGEGCVYPDCYIPSENPAVGYDDNCKPPNCFLDLND